MGLVSGNVPQVGAPRETEESDVTTLLTNLLAAVNGGLDSANIADGGVVGADLAAAVQAAAGLNGASTRRGKSIIATEEARTNTAFGMLATPDRVQNIVLPTDGLIFVAYQALWKESVNDTATAAIFLDAVQLRSAVIAQAAPVVTDSEARPDTSANVYTALSSGPLGLVGSAGATGTGTGSHVTTGQAVGYSNSVGFQGGVCAIFAAADTYDVSVQFKSTSGTVTVKERKLWVWSMGFD